MLAPCLLEGMLNCSKNNQTAISNRLGLILDKIKNVSVFIFHQVNQCIQEHSLHAPSGQNRISYFHKSVDYIFILFGRSPL